MPLLSFYCSANTPRIVFYLGQSFLTALWDPILMFSGRSENNSGCPQWQGLPRSQRVLLEKIPYLPLVEDKRGAVLADHQISLTVSWMCSELPNP